MKSTTLALLAAAALAPWAASAAPAGGLPPHVCEGPAGEHNPNCKPNGPGGPAGPPSGVPGDDAPGLPGGPDDAPTGEGVVPEPGAAALFAAGALLVARRGRRR